MTDPNCAKCGGVHYSEECPWWLDRHPDVLITVVVVVMLAVGAIVFIAVGQ